MKVKLSDVPWLKDGALDMTKVPLDSNFKTALGRDRAGARGSLSVLASATAYGRTEASVFLMGFLVNLPDDDWEMRIDAVEALQHTKTARCAALLFSELRRVKGSNTTRRYLNKIIDVLKRFPADIVQGGFEALAGDTSLSQKMRAKLRSAAESNLHGAVEL